MTDELVMVSIASLLLAAGMWLMLPRGAAAGRSLGAVFVAASLGLLAAELPALGSWAASAVFYLLAGITVASAVATVTFRNPVYSAIWFGLSLLGTAGLFLYEGAQFLGVATIVVYAGAILVTFLFVLMLAQPEGTSACDRRSWAPALSAVGGALMVGILTLALAGVFQNPVAENRPVSPADPAALAGEVLSRNHMAHLGAELFSRYLLPVEVAGTLLLVALVGTVAIVGQIKRPSTAGGRRDG